MQKILLARHGETPEKYRNKYLGSTDVTLSENGKKSCLRLAETVQRYRPQRCYCSPMLRARLTSEIITNVKSIPTTYIEDFREIDFGRWEGLSYKEIVASDPDLVQEWVAHPETFQFPDGENTADFRRRVCQTANGLQALDDCLVIAHGGVVRTLLCHYLGISLNNYLLFKVKPARLGVIDLYDEGGVLIGFNL